ncbi:MAG: transposase [Gammaproteobacteria bacterium]|nr:transposase [Gammaproteobacteria bacterium]
MARKPRIHYPGAFYHVILRGNNKQQIFFSSKDQQYFYSLLEESITRYNYRIHAFCLMTNHVHLLLQIGVIPLSKIMQNLCFRYTQMINKLQHKVGHLFQGRYKAILVDVDSYLLELVRYIHLNPVRAKMVSNVEDYHWSSHRTYRKLDKNPWLTKNVVLSYFDQNENIAAIRYLNFMHDNISESLNLTTSTQHTYDILGDDDFLQGLQINVEMKKYPISLENITRMVCLHYSINQSNLTDKSRSRVNTKLRATIGWLVKEFNICTLSNVAKFFSRDPTGLSRSIRNIESENKTKKELNELKNLIEKSICQA